MTRLLGLNSWSLAPCESMMDWEQQQACACDVLLYCWNSSCVTLQRRPYMTHCSRLVSSLHRCNPTPRTHKTSQSRLLLTCLLHRLCLLLQCVHHSNTPIGGSWLCGAQCSAAQSETPLQQQPAPSKHKPGDRVCMEGCSACGTIMVLVTATVAAAESCSMCVLGLQYLRVSAQGSVHG